MPRPDHAGRPGRGQQLQCLGQAGGSGRVVPGQPLRHGPGLKGSGLTNPQIGERQYISRRTVQTRLVYVFAKLDLAFRAPARRPGHPPPLVGAAPALVAPAEDSAPPGELPRGTYPPGTVRSPAADRRKAAVYGPARSRAPTTGSAGWRMSDAARGGTVETTSPREGDGRRGRRRLIVTEEL